MLIVMSGLPGSGKSTLAQALAPRLPATILNKDSARAALFPSSDITYTSHQDDFVVHILLQVAEFYFEQDPQRKVILDGRTFYRQYQVTQVLDFCRLHERPVAFIACTCPDEIACERLKSAQRSGEHPAADRNYELYQRMKVQSEPLEIPHLRVDTSQALELCIQISLHYLQSL